MVVFIMLLLFPCLHRTCASVILSNMFNVLSLKVFGTSCWMRMNFMTKILHLGADAVKPSELDSSLKPAGSIQTKATRSLLEDETGGLPSGNHLQTKNTEDARGITNTPTPTPTEISDSQAKQGQGALPEGFFDNKEADLRARGIKPVKPDVK